MQKTKNKNSTYGTFAVAKQRISDFKKAAGLIVLAVVLIIGLGVIIFKMHSPVPIKVAQIKPSSEEIPGWWYQQYFGWPSCERDICKPNFDADADGLTNYQEYYYHTDPLNPNTIGDKLTDGQLVAQGFDPSRSGKMTFDQVADPDNILGESLLVQTDIKDLVSESQDISKVPIPIVSQSDLNITNKETSAAYNAYMTALQNAQNKYFPNSDLDSIVAQLKTSNGQDVAGVKTKAAMLAIELKSIPVPQRAITYHQDMIAFFNLLSKVLMDQGQTLDMSGTQGDLWYADAQAFFAVSQKMNLEQQLLQKYIDQIKS